ncbi:hypothetical protein [Mycobacterium marinum]|uniref:hypothetical protein n=1 Tax=Mycobacterium marinum TaxID=1781 RepID=UPI0023598148|nr:hypothetical protein [Mycobacterium marinum]MDC9005236.1 hypothetical protein [Mycobacterium marinum]
MTAMNPKQALETCEHALRRLMAYVYEQQYGPDWLRQISNSPQRKLWAQRATDEMAQNPGAAVVPPIGLAYSQFEDLVLIAKKFWGPLEPALGQQAETLPLLERFDKLRHRIAHNRDLLTYQRDLVSGIAGQIRNQVTIFMSNQAPSGEFYPRIEVATDDFGNQITPGPPAADSYHDGLCRADQILHVGDTVSFTCTGTDPKDRPLTWTLTATGSSPTSVTAASGATVELVWAAETTSECLEVFIELKSPSEYHRRFHSDATVCFVYRVLPPAE